MERIEPRARSDAYGSRINRSHSPLLANFMPWVSIMIASFLPALFIASAVPVIPPLGYLALLAWRLVRPGLLPVWAGFLLGLFDDLYSGQPFGFAIAFWSLTMLAIEAIEMRWPWRAFWQDWIVASLLILLYIAGAWLFSGGIISLPSFLALIPQFVLSILIFPIFTRIIARLDRIRLIRWRQL